VTLKNDSKRYVEVLACLGKFIRGCILQIQPQVKLFEGLQDQKNKAKAKPKEPRQENID